MEFQKERCYTAANADELKVGSKVILADTLDALKEHVIKRENLVYVLGGICDETYERRFELSASSHFSLAYLVSEPEEKKLKWTDLKIGDFIKNENSLVCMVTAIDVENTNRIHIYAGDLWLSDSELADDWEKVEK